MDLKSFLNSLPDAAAREAFALKCETSYGHLKNIAHGYNDKKCSTELGVAIEIHSDGLVPRQESCPDTWRKRWPELRELASSAQG